MGLALNLRTNAKPAATRKSGMRLARARSSKTWNAPAAQGNRIRRTDDVWSAASGTLPHCGVPELVTGRRPGSLRRELQIMVSLLNLGIGVWSNGAVERSMQNSVVARI
jgi:hypothetical protein